MGAVKGGLMGVVGERAGEEVTESEEMLPGEVLLVRLLPLGQAVGGIHGKPGAAAAIRSWRITLSGCHTVPHTTYFEYGNNGLQGPTRLASPQS